MEEVIPLILSQFEPHLTENEKMKNITSSVDICFINKSSSKII
jgi:hypothetical protein